MSFLNTADRKPEHDLDTGVAGIFGGALPLPT